MDYYSTVNVKNGHFLNELLSDAVSGDFSSTHVTNLDQLFV